MSWQLALALAVLAQLVLSAIGLHVLAERARRRDVEAAQHEARELQGRHVTLRRLDRDDWGITGWVE